MNGERFGSWLRPRSGVLPDKKGRVSVLDYDFFEAETLWHVLHNVRFGLWWYWQSKVLPQLQQWQPPKPRVFVPVVRIPTWAFVFAGLAGGLMVVSFGFYQLVLFDLPSPRVIREQNPIVSTKIYDRDGELLYTVYKDENRSIVTLDDISPYAIMAAIAIEDEQFYEHWGISFRGISRAFVHNLRSETVQGGSTITQQLVKNTLLTPERTWRRKVREIVLALAVDWQYSKEDILERYLNEVNYGGPIHGIEQASQWFFGKSASELSLGESALLAGLPVAPTTYNPFGLYPELSQQRQHDVLKRMLELGFISEQELQEAKQEKLQFTTQQHDIKAPHFVMYVRDLLAKTYGEDMVSQGGLEVYTTLDLDVQASAEAAVAQELETLGRLKVSNGAALVTNPKSGEVLAMVGSRDYFDTENDGQVNVVFRERQPGSSIKPVTYSLAFENGFSPASMIDDVPVVYTAPGAPPYAPKNYDGRFHGRVSLREALASSYNVPAVRLLAEVGVDPMIRHARAMGISTWEDSSRFGLALTLGAGEVKMYDMAEVYGVFANGGERVELNPIVSVHRFDGTPLYRNPCIDAVYPCNGERVLSSHAAYQITSVLSDNTARAPAFGTASVLQIPGQEVAVKTGTTNNLRDNWTIGYTNDAVVLTWVGNNDNTPMSAVASGITGASPIWNTIMAGVLEGHSHYFALPTGLKRVKICQTTGTLPCAGCPKVVEEVMPAHRVPTQACRPEQFEQGDSFRPITANSQVAP